MLRNVCNFIPYRNDYHSLHTIHFVFETKKQVLRAPGSIAMYRVHYVCSGEGILHLAGKTINLTEGDVFFIFPGMAYCLESVNNFTYMYISFLGSRTNMIMDNLKISTTNLHFSKCDDLFDIWKNGLHIKHEISDLMTESILLHTFYFLGDRFLLSGENEDVVDTFALKVKNFIDDNYSDSSLSLEMIGKNLSYSPKYISAAFKKYFKVGLSEYITTLRVQHACSLMQLGFTSISDIANQCGYAEPQYFSKIFKKVMHVLPSDYIKNLK